MSEGIEAIGINGKILLAQIVNFAILFLVLWFFAFKPILKMLDERKDKIAKAESDAQAIEKAKAETEVKTKAILAEAQDQAKKIVDDAVKLATSQKADIAQSAQKEADNIKAQTEKQLEAEKERIIKEAKLRLAEVVIVATGKLIEQTVDEQTAKRLTEAAVKESSE